MIDFLGKRWRITESLCLQQRKQRIISPSEMNGTLYETTEKDIQAEIRRFMSGKMIYREG